MRRFFLPWGSIVLLSLAGCATPEEDLELPVEPPAAFSASGEAWQPDRWWTTFDDPVLNQLVADALQSNFDLAEAWERLREAQAVLDREGAEYIPTLDAVGTAQARDPESAEDAQLRLGLTATYEVDLWGRIRSSVAAERFRAEATYADYQTAALTLSGEIARTWYELVTARAQRDLLAAQVRTNEQVLESIETRFGSGTVRSVDILRQQQLIESTREQLLDAEARVRVTEHLLAVLLGQSPTNRNTDFPQGMLPELPPLPATGLPSELVQRRPDLQQRFLLLRAADSEVAAAVANRFPRLNLSASVFTEETETINLFDEWVASIAADLVLPLIDGGQRRAEVDRTEAVRAQRFYAWSQAVLEAFREVEDALTLEQAQEKRIRSLRRQVDLSEQAYERLRTEYLNGVSDYIDVLAALTGTQALRRELLSAQLLLLEYRINLYRALAGSFETQRERNDDPDEDRPEL